MGIVLDKLLSQDSSQTDARIQSVTECEFLTPRSLHRLIVIDLSIYPSAERDPYGKALWLGDAIAVAYCIKTC